MVSDALHRLRPDAQVVISDQPRCDRLLELHPDVVVVDGSPATTVQLHDAAVAVVHVRPAGAATDPDHRAAQRVADRILVPCRRSLDVGVELVDFGDRTLHCGAIGFETQLSMRPVPIGRRPEVVVVWDGAGPPPPAGPSLDRAALATPLWDWVFAGPATPVRMPTVVDHVGQPGVDVEIEDLVRRASVIVGHDDDLAPLAARESTPLVAIADHRPLDTQLHEARMLERAGLAVVTSSWPKAERWVEVLDRASEVRPPESDVLRADGAAARAAAAVLDVAAASRRRPGSAEPSGAAWSAASDRARDVVLEVLDRIGRVGRVSEPGPTSP